MQLDHKKNFPATFCSCLCSKPRFVLMGNRENICFSESEIMVVKGRDLTDLKTDTPYFCKTDLCDF